ncbi:anti-sigma B factor RsbW [Bacillus thuringiensis]|uniref:anti-sigma B factor RsbW n=1 Tax=Bacillus thuringiensis TaxID=1428 RepID=UPI000BFA2DD8|nr:anti-sigma B factor RsbW [Bacillus thuringiensis]PES10178.1 anti-sigma B factor RsbW [Bacillus anthracis]PEZ36430.1 anti-sigma B factor RsbW [Bacillus thuringiensis]PGY49214.1 anti-sigma B factor RsbW [Bacillus thuringiensis]
MQPCPPDYIELKIPAKTDYLGMIRLTVSGITNYMQFSYDEIEDIKIAVSEACTNVVQHAYLDKETGDITIGFGLFSDRLEIMIADQGERFDFEKRKQGMGPYNPSHPIDALPESGLGMYVMHSVMDTVEISYNHGMTVLLIKHLQREWGERDERTHSIYPEN